MRYMLALIISLQLLFCGGCAVFNRNNTPALNYVEAHWVPKDTTARAISSPVLVPLGFTAATLDLVLFHPISVAGDAWHDTNDILWRNLDWDDKYVTTTVLNAPRAVAVPVVFTVDLLARSSFDISRRGGDPRFIKEGPPGRHKAPAPKTDENKPNTSSQSL